MGERIIIYGVCLSQRTMNFHYQKAIQTMFAGIFHYV